MTTISLSLAAICSDILAESALYHHINPDKPTPLTSDNVSLLRQLVSGEFANLCLELSPVVDSTTVSPDGEIMQITFNCHPAHAGELRRSIERLLALRVMVRGYASAVPSQSAALKVSATAMYDAVSAQVADSADGGRLRIPSVAY